MTGNPWAVSPELLEAVKSILPVDGTILEIGSGSGTKDLRDLAFSVYSIEENMDYVVPSEGPHTTFLVPIDPATNWYDVEALKKALEGLRYDLILIDGPAGHNREGFIPNFDLFDLDAAIVVDDMHRGSNQRLAEAIKAKTGREYTIHKTKDVRTFALFTRHYSPPAPEYLEGHKGPQGPTTL